MSIVKKIVSLLLTVSIVVGFNPSLSKSDNNPNGINMEIFNDLQSTIQSALSSNQGSIIKITERRYAPVDGYTAACDLIVQYKDELTYQLGENGEGTGTLRETTELPNLNKTQVPDPKKTFDFKGINKTTKLINPSEVTTAQMEIYGDFLIMCHVHYYEDVWRVDIDENTYMITGYYRQDLLGEMTHLGAPIETKYQLSVFKSTSGDLLKITLKGIKGKEGSLTVWTFA